MDSFYRVLNEKEHELAGQNQHNFDHPDAFDFELLKETLQRLKEGKKVEVPIYNFVTHRREAKTTSMYGANVLIFEGILAFHDKVIQDKSEWWDDMRRNKQLISFENVLAIMFLL